MRIAWFTPFGERSAIGHYSAVIVEAISTAASVTVFAATGDGSGAPRSTDLDVIPVPPVPDEGLMRRLREYDVAVYNMGNHMPNHLPVYETALRHPGIVILHDLVLQDFFLGYSVIHRKQPEEFPRLLGYAHGPEAETVGRAVVSGRRTLGNDAEALLARPLFKPAVRRALGVLVHSEFARRRVEPEVAVPVERIDFPIFGPTTRFAERPPQRSARADGRVAVLTFGELNPNKLIHATIEAIGRSPELRKQVRFVVIGSGPLEYEQQLRELVRRHSLDGVVTLAGYRNDDELRDALVAADVCVNLRNPHLGESSGSLLNSLVAGVPTVVWDHGFYGEFPDDVVVKIRSETELAPALVGLVRDPARRRRMGLSARSHSLARFDIGEYCQRFWEFVERVRRNRPFVALADRVSDFLVELGSSDLDGLSGRFGAELAALTPAQDPNPESDHDGTSVGGRATGLHIYRVA
jgi:glycosyltransferase involved in cell wall biosynthesis